MARQLAGIVALLALLLSGASAAVAEKTPSTCTARLQENLQGMVGLPESSWRFVILEESETGSYIQFAWWGSVVVDLPLVALDVEQQARAAQVFDKLGAGTPLIDPGPDDAAAEPTQTFQHDFGRDVAEAARFGCTALRSIYQLAEDLPLDIKVGGD